MPPSMTTSRASRGRVMHALARHVAAALHSARQLLAARAQGEAGAASATPLPAACGSLLRWPPRRRAFHAPNSYPHSGHRKST